MSLIKVVCYVLRVKDMHPGSPSDPSGTAAAKAKPRYVHSILKPHGQSSRSPVRIYYSSISSRPQCRSQVAVCVSTPRKYPRSGYLLVYYRALKNTNLAPVQFCKGRTVFPARCVACTIFLPNNYLTMAPLVPRLNAAYRLS